MKKSFIFVILVFCCLTTTAQPKPAYDLKSDSLAKRWDEAIPLGDGWLGALIWQKENKLRISLDRVDLWDDRPMPEINKLRFNWVVEKVKMNQYDSVQKIGDEPYEKYPAPTKIPGAAIEFDLKKLGKVISNELHIENGLSIIKFANGVVFNNYIHAVKQIGYFGFENIKDEIIPDLIVPDYYSVESAKTGNSVEGQSLKRLGYKKGTVKKTINSILYHQPTWGVNYYEVLIRWQKLPGNRMIGQWTITNNKHAFLPALNPAVKEPTGWPAHVKWWKDYWSRSSVSLPDSLIEKQYYLEMYKFACVARSNTPPISLQAIWTADNGNLPPWKGDFHHDLNTELSYWPGYAGNHLDLTAGYTNWVWKIKEENKKWTRQYFGVNGLNVPGVTTISGKPMGGWIQYSMSTTTAAWLAQHFYWQWKYSMDKKFLKERCQPYFAEVEKFQSKIRTLDSIKRKYKIPLSSSPEYNDNSIKAWFSNFTNYDLSLIHYLNEKYAEILNQISGGSSREILSEDKLYPDFNVNETGLTVAPGQNLDESHRHMSPYMAIYPLGLLNVDESIQKNIINESLHWIEKKGTRNWCGYSFSWMACLYARAKEAANAVKQLQIFASNFCSSNSFHLNGDQKGGQYSSFTYRPFTLEGNFAFAQAVHELLLQCHKGYIEVFPAVPDSWKNVSFNTLRTEGAFLVSGKKENEMVKEVRIKSEAGGKLRIKLPFENWKVSGIDSRNIIIKNGIAEMPTVKGEIIILKNNHE